MSQTKPNALVLAGNGLNCDEETRFAFEQAGAKAKIVHINDLIDGHRLDDYRILAFPGGFSYGDDTGSGNAMANRIRNNLWDELLDFVKKDRLMIGICNGFQVMVNLGLLPALGENYGERSVALVHNDSARYVDRWVDLDCSAYGPWLRGIARLSAPVAHGEGRFYTDHKTLEKLLERHIAVRYVGGEICAYQNRDPNPNGSLFHIAGITDQTGRLLGMMPHPERAIHQTQLPHWTWLREKAKREGRDPDKENHAQGLKFFENAVRYFEED